MAVGGAKLALLLIHILSVAGNGYSSSQDNDHGGDDHEHRKKLISSLKSGFVIGYVFSSVSIITIFMSYCVPWARLMKRKGNEVMMKTPMMTSLMERQEKKRKEANVQKSELEKKVTRTSFAALNIATRSFDQDNVIGVGRMGTMYRAAHPYDCFTAVKRLHDSQPLGKQFRSELNILAKFRHMNIIPLLGFCVESGERLLVYKYMPNGNLHDWLHPVKCNAEKLDWHVRVKIAIGVARGLAWLHDFNSFLIVHLDICSRSILLDKYFEPKISNFGGAMHRRSNDKSLIASSKIGEVELIKQDVYQFGILLLELIAVHDPDHNSKSSHTLEENLFERIAHLSSSSYRLYHAVDKSLLGQGFDGEILHFLKIASSCIHPILDQRPTMLQAFQMLMVMMALSWSQQKQNGTADVCLLYNIVVSGFVSETIQMASLPKHSSGVLLEGNFHLGEEGYKNELRRSKAMEWGVRVKVAVGLARGLAWLHQNCHTVKIIHLDISSKCILLDQNFQPKLSNFGEAMLVTSTCASSVNSEFWEMAFVKEDVHGFGVVLLEMITGVDPSNMTASSNNVLNEWIAHLSSNSDFHGAVDKSLIGKGFDAEIIQLLKVACTCVDPIPDRRPIMVQVYEDIKAIRERCDLVDDSSLLMQPEICPATSEKSVEIEMAEFQ
ncbi:hypothetical protein POTOM_054442 [Populus tomentosa]|uniref:Protein kinase domain-containing protein n=1 Tax=Populus tomentosa TaxID=118781 RepID=A0A8X7Y0G5_POPTO|nr:hypothetical protein POTOM_054442 [Populus tomentosa]